MLVREQDSFQRLVIQCYGDLQQERITDKIGGGKQQQKNTKYGHYPHPGGVRGGGGGGEKKDRKKEGKSASNHWPLVIPC